MGPTRRSLPESGTPESGTPESAALDSAALDSGRSPSSVGTRLLAGYRLAVAALVLVAVGTQLANSSGRGFSAANFFSFFTIQSNLLGAAAFIAAALAPRRTRQSFGLSLFRGAATLYMAITGVVFSLLLRGLQESLQTTVPWINTVLHYLFPLVIVVDWLLDRTVRGLRTRDGLLFLIYPIAYLAYSLIRGPIVDWYPYPFIDPRATGYGQVVIGSLVVAVVAVAAATLLCWASRVDLGRPSSDVSPRPPTPRSGATP